MRSLLGCLILLIFTCLMFTKTENNWYYLIYLSVIIYCILNMNHEIEN